MKHPPLQHWIAVSLISLTAFAVRAISLDAQSLWRDEVDSLRFATAPWPEILANFVRPGWNGPLYFLLLRGWVALVGTSAYAMRFFSLVFGVLAVPLVYVLGRRLFDRPAGLFAALLVTVSPYLAWYGQEVRMYTLVTALAILAVYGLRRAVESGNARWWTALVVAASLAFYLHILAALLVPVLALAYCAGWPQARKHWRGALISLACLTLPYLPLARWQVPLAFQARETGFGHYTLGEMALILLNGWSAGITGWGGLWSVLLMAVLAVWGGMSPRTPPLHPFPFPRKQGKWVGVGVEIRSLLAWLLFPLLTVWFISLRQPLFTDRYLIWSAPAFYLLVGTGLASLWRLGGWRRWSALVLVLAILFSHSANLYLQATRPIKADFRAAAAYVADYRSPAPPPAVVPQPMPGAGRFRLYLPLVLADYATFDGLLVFHIPYARYSFDYYFPIEGYPWAEGPYTNWRAPDGSYLIGAAEVARQMQALTAGYDTVWLIATETAMWDERGLVKAWLDANMRLETEARFQYVEVYRYVRDQYH